MREIKFRAWDEDRKKMLFDFKLENYTSDGETFRLNAPSEKRNGDYQSLILMQYTGLKDKSGREIFEGDIVRGRYGQWIPSDLEKVFEVFWMNHGAWFPSGDFKCEIIGNIYENPELLTPQAE